MKYKKSNWTATKPSILVRVIWRNWPALKVLISSIFVVLSTLVRSKNPFWQPFHPEIRWKSNITWWVQRTCFVKLTIPCHTKARQDPMVSACFSRNWFSKFRAIKEILLPYSVNGALYLLVVHVSNLVESVSDCFFLVRWAQHDHMTGRNVLKEGGGMVWDQLYEGKYQLVLLFAAYIAKAPCSVNGRNLTETHTWCCAIVCRARVIEKAGQQRHLWRLKSLSSAWCCVWSSVNLRDNPF